MTRQTPDTQTIHANCGHTYLAPIDADGAHLAGLPCTRCVGRDYPAEYRSPDTGYCATCRHCGQPISRGIVDARRGDQVLTIIGRYPGIDTPIYSTEYTGHPDYHPACWIEHVSERQAKWDAQRRQADAARAEFMDASHAAYLSAVAFEPRLSGVPGLVTEFGDSRGRGYRFTPQGELPIVDVQNGTATYPDVSRNRQLRKQGIIQ